MSTALIQVVVALVKGAAVATPTGAAFAATSVVVTDSSGTAQPAVLLTGNETTPWSFTASVAAGAGTVVATDIDITGAALGTPITQAFSETGSTGGTSPAAQYQPTTTISVTPA